MKDPVSSDPLARFAGAPLMTPAAMGRVDRAAAERGIDVSELMERAGRAVARALARRFAPGPVAVLAGPGDNGGDGWVAADLLRAAGRPTRVFAAGPPASPAARAKAERWRAPVEALEAFEPGRFAVVVDALFGGGLARPLEGAFGAAIERLAGCSTPVVAIDLPSGLDGASGRALGTVAPAALTVAFERVKPGHVLEPGASLCGALEIAPIGLPADLLEAEDEGVRLAGPSLWREALPPLARDAHKYRRGCVLLAAGAAGRTGAARLAARAALRAGAGAIVVAAERAAIAELAAGLPDAAMTRVAGDAAAWRALLADPKHRALALGPGGGRGEAMRERVLDALATAKPTVLDADALTSFEERPEALFEAIRGPVVLTPHEGEFARLFGERRDDPSTACRAAAARAGCVVLLKGPVSVVAAPDGRAVLARSAPPVLATAGSGDVLTGFVAANLARGAFALEAGAAAMDRHAALGRALGEGAIADDLAAAKTA